MMEPTGYDLAGQIAIVTGGGEGIGWASGRRAGRLNHELIASD
jgi:NAD(P)-dependent dehydrogenase (short-subunit alcohol dehydrogenase family)